MITLQNSHWQVGIVPEHGGGLVFGRIRYSGVWMDVLRLTPEDQYDKPSSFLMLPWANRIRDGVLRFQGKEWKLQTNKDDGTARHGDVRKRPWRVVTQSDLGVHMRLDSTDFDDFNFPFAFRADLTYTLDGATFNWQVKLTNRDAQTFPAGFGFHPYFQHTNDHMPLLQVPCNKHFELVGSMAHAAPVPVPPALDFRQERPVTSDMVLDDLLTDRIGEEPIRLIYEDWGRELKIYASPIFQHVVVFTAPDGTLAVEPQTNANDGFNLYEDGIEGSGVFELAPGESVTGTVRLRIG